MGLASSFNVHNAKFLRNCSAYVIKLCNRNINRFPYRPPQYEPGDFPFLKRRVPPEGEQNLAARLAAIKASQTRNADLMEPIDIGLPFPPDQKTSKKSRGFRRRPELESVARKNQLLIPLEEVQKEWLTEQGIKTIVTVAHHYNIFADLFTRPHFFHPVVELDVFFPDLDAPEGADEEVLVSPVYFGNTLPAILASNPPNLRFESPECAKKGLWTLVMTSPDEHLEDPEKEYLHWMVSNIPVDENEVSNISAGQLVCPYLPPIPPRGSGYHRYIFLLYHHEEPIDFASEKRQENCRLHERTFSTYDFYSNHQDRITPAGFAFFQSTWDPSVRVVFHETLDMAEPAFEYEWPREHREQQVRFPQGEAFDKYLDKYRDTKDINEELLKERLKLVHPFKDYPPPLKYPNAEHNTRKLPTWLQDKEKQKRLRQGIWKDLQ